MLSMNKLKQKKKTLSWNTRCKLFLLPSLIGSIIFFFWPYIRVLYYSVIDNQFSRKIVGLSNYMKTLSNPYFQLAMKNSLLLILIGVPIIVILAIVISLLITYQLNNSRTDHNRP